MGGSFGAKNAALLAAVSLLLATVACPPNEVPWPSSTGGIDCQNAKTAAAEALAFLETNAPTFDSSNIVSLSDGVFRPTVNASLEARIKYSWAAAVPKEVFNDWVLPYASVNEARSDWPTSIGIND